MLTGFLIAASASEGQVVCGSTNVFAQSTKWMKDIASEVGMGYLLGNKEVQCGMSGEDFPICRKCETSLGPESFSVVRPMLAREQHRTWMDRWKQEFQSKEVRISPADFKVEQTMNHVRRGESVSEFEKRSNSNWGESYLFTHRQVYKMLQLEMTVNGKACFGPREKWPTRWDDSSIPAPAGTTAQALLGQVNQGFQLLDSPGELSADKLSLNRLGQRLEMMGRQLAKIYSDPASKKNCQGAELESSTCDDLTSTKSAHVNPRYWEIHSYLDSFIGKWLRTNGYEEIAIDCEGRPKCYQWQGTYTATYPF